MHRLCIQALKPQYNASSSCIDAEIASCYASTSLRKEAAQTTLELSMQLNTNAEHAAHVSTANIMVFGLPLWPVSASIKAVWSQLHWGLIGGGTLGSPACWFTVGGVRAGASFSRPVRMMKSRLPCKALDVKPTIQILRSSLGFQL